MPGYSFYRFWVIKENQTFPLRLGLNGRNIPYIPPLFHDNKFIVDFKENSEIFTSFIAEQYSLIDNVSALPSPFLLITDKSLSDVDFSKKDIKSLRKLDLSKAHDCKMVSPGKPGKKCVKDYRPVSLLPIYCKVFETRCFCVL